MRGPEEWPSRRSNPADRIRLTGPAATNLSFQLFASPKSGCDAGVTHLQAFLQENDDLRRPISPREAAIIEAPGLAQEANDFEANNFRVADNTPGIAAGPRLARVIGAIITATNGAPLRHKTRRL